MFRCFHKSSIRIKTIALFSTAIFITSECLDFFLFFPLTHFFFFFFSLQVAVLIILVFAILVPVLDSVEVQSSRGDIDRIVTLLRQNLDNLYVWNFNFKLIFS